MKTPDRRWLMRAAVALVLLAAVFAGWRLLKPKGLPEGIVAGNGRIEAVEIDVAAKIPGRLRDILVDEGDFVKAGQVVAHMDTETLLAQRAEAEARLQEATNAVDIANSQLVQRQSERTAAAAALRERETEVVSAQRRFARSDTLAREGATPIQERDDDLDVAVGVAHPRIADQYLDRPRHRHGRHRRTERGCPGEQDVASRHASRC